MNVQDMLAKIKANAAPINSKYHVSFGKSSVICDSLKDCSKAFCKWRDVNDFGSSDLKKKDGEVRLNGKVVARISYNGRVWDIEGKEINV